MLRRSVAIVAALVALAACHGKPTATDLDGRAIDPLADRSHVVVLVFVSTQCPVSNRYAPELERLRARYATVAFWLVYPTGSEGTAAIATHLDTYALRRFQVARDPSHMLVARADVRRTPEAAVFAHGELVYHGRIDDRQVDFGVTRPEATQHDLEDAIDAALAGRSVPTPTTSAVGCAIPPP